jgi:hypothetical protein
MIHALEYVLRVCNARTADAAASFLRNEMSIYFVKLEYPVIYSAWIPDACIDQMVKTSYFSSESSEDDLLIYVECKS